MKEIFLSDYLASHYFEFDFPKYAVRTEYPPRRFDTINIFGNDKNDDIEKDDDYWISERRGMMTCNTEEIYYGTEKMCRLWLTNYRNNRARVGKGSNIKVILSWFLAEETVQGRPFVEKDNPNKWEPIKAGSEIKSDWEYRIEPEKTWKDATSLKEAFELLKKDPMTRHYGPEDWFLSGLEAQKRIEYNSKVQTERV